MTAELRPGIVVAARWVSGSAGVVAILVGLLALVGWMIDLAVLKSVIPGLVTMKVNSALAFLLAGVSLRLLAAHNPLLTSFQRWEVLKNWMNPSTGGNCWLKAAIFAPAQWTS